MTALNKKTWFVITFGCIPHRAPFRSGGSWWVKIAGSVNMAQEICTGKLPLNKYFHDDELVVVSAGSITRKIDLPAIVKSFYV
jgi:hypothetical protein